MVSPSQSKAILTTGQVAKVCRVAPRTVSKWFDSGRLKGYRIPGSQDRRIPRENLLRFLRENNMPIDILGVEDSQNPVLVVTDDKRTTESVLALNSPEATFVVNVVKNAFEAGQYRRIPRVIVIDFAIGRSESLQLVRALRDAHRDQQPRVQFYAIVGEDEPNPLSMYKPDLFDHVAQQPRNVAAMISEMFTEQTV